MKWKKGRNNIKKWFSFIIFNLFVCGVFASTWFYTTIQYPRKIDINTKAKSGDFNIECKIYYYYKGDWIGGCSKERLCSITRVATVYGDIHYFGKNSNLLVSIKIPEDFRVLKRCDAGIDYEYEIGGNTMANFAFKEDEPYYCLFYPISKHIIKIKNLKSLFFESKIHVIKIKIHKVVIDWEYLCRDSSSSVFLNKNPKRKKVEKKGNFSFPVNEEIKIELNYIQ